MIDRLRICAVAMLAATSFSWAQAAEPATGGPPAANMTKEQRLERAMAQFKESPTEEAAKQVVLKRYKLEVEGKLMEAMKLLSPDFTEHMTPKRMPPAGKTGYQVQMERAQRAAANPTSNSGDSKSATFAYQARASEDLVTLFHAYGCDIFRVKNGLVSDHWDCTPWEPFSNKGERAQLTEVAESNRMGGGAPPAGAPPAGPPPAAAPAAVK